MVRKSAAYIGNPKETSETIDGDGWLHTGDLGYFDTDGYLYIVDRLKELIKYKANQVSKINTHHLFVYFVVSSKALLFMVRNERYQEFVA